MLKQLITASSILALLLVGNLPAAHAGTQQSVPQNSQQILAQANNVSSSELQQFASVYKKLVTLEQQFQAQIVQVIQSEGFTRERFVEIYEAQTNPQAQPGSEISQSEMESFQQVVAQAQAIRQETQVRQQEAVAESGLDANRFQEILAAIKNSPELQQEVEALIQQ
ncbi:DUF4168 domain-containing protein [Phormidium sp. CCY1219]|uniref:DUF4168 domain-containing protein n=1 Tax=Phormidium sp. CCY1219 TaxID=2886104 RepID=UPI002D1F55F1|nr:DUF4168 domain-containing protein [Phormidium sp. CCY1219]MEB3826319.1 DUF4168 domain-containing protein [Phormidium sp. CCY1219]